MESFLFFEDIRAPLYQQATLVMANCCSRLAVGSKYAQKGSLSCGTDIKEQFQGLAGSDVMLSLSSCPF